jgi:hypothetical protein
MRYILALSALLLIATASPTTAREYKWCAQTITNPSGDCSFSYYQQCLATISGQGGDCIANPRMAYGQMRGNRRAQQLYGRDH